MRGFPLNLNHGGLGGEDGPAGFPYFTDKFDFTYGGPVGFHHDFFTGHPPPHPHGPPFAGPGNPGELRYCHLFYTERKYYLYLINCEFKVGKFQWFKSNTCFTNYEELANVNEIIGKAPNKESNVNTRRNNLLCPHYKRKKVRTVIFEKLAEKCNKML